VYTTTNTGTAVGKNTSNGLHVSQSFESVRSCLRQWLTSIAEASAYQDSKLWLTCKPLLVFLHRCPLYWLSCTNGIDNPIYKVSELDRGQGLKYIAQRGVPDTLLHI